jgi:hypothetical protein
MAVLAAVLLAPAWLAAQPATPLRFSAGTNNASVNGQLKGPNEAARDYVVQSVPGTTLDVSLRTQSKETFFSIVHPYGDTLYTNQGDQRTSWNGRLVDGGNYRVRVFLDPAAAGQGRGAAYTLNVKVEPPR